MIVQSPAYPENDKSVYKYILKDVFVGDGVKKTNGYVTQSGVQIDDARDKFWGKFS